MWAGWFTLFVLAAMTVIIARDRLGPDLTMFGALCLLIITGVISPFDALEGFSNPALFTIGTLFVVAAAVRESGALVMVSRLVFGSTRNPRIGVARMVVPTAILSGFVNNTAVVAMLIPAVQDFSRKIGQSPSRFLMPLAYAAMLGGTCTLIGTSANLVVSGLLEAHNLPALGMLEISLVGIPTMALGALYLTTLGYRLLEARVAPIDHIHKDRRQYLAEVLVADDAPLIGKTVEEAGLRQLPGLFLAEIRRVDGQRIQPVAPHDLLLPGDHLILSGIASTVQQLQNSFPGLLPIDEPTLELEMERGLFEVVLSHRSNLVGRTVREIGFRRRYDAAILAVHRAGERIHQRIGDIVLRPGDTLMLSASPGFYDTWRDSPQFYLVSSVATSGPIQYRNAQFTLFLLAVLVVVPTVTSLPMMVAGMAAVVILLATRSVSARGARQAIDWSVLLVIGSALGLAKALETSGAAGVLGELLVTLTQPMGPIAILAGVYIIAMLCASLLTNAAAAALTFPIAITAAEVAQLDPRPLTIAVALAASAAFATPVGSNAILLIHGAGGYRYRDFVRVGLPLNLLCISATLILLPWLWPLSLP